MAIEKAMRVVASFDERGPAKSWADLTAIQRHNSREEALPHVLADAPAPSHLIGSGDLEVSVRAILTAHGIDPDARRSNGVLVYELILSADHGFFASGTAAERATALAGWVAATIPFLNAKYGKDRLASVVLHQDEYTPHIHAVIVPLERKTYASGETRWALIGRIISGPGKYAKMHTEYAAAVAHLGLTRGKERSHRKRRPYGDVIEEVESAKRNAEIAQQQAQQAEAQAQERQRQMEADREETGKLLRDAQLQARSAERLKLKVAVSRRQIEKMREELGEREAEIARREALLNSRQAKLADQQRAVSIARAEADAATASATRDIASVARLREVIAEAGRYALQLRRAMAQLPAERMPDFVRSALSTADSLMTNIEGARARIADEEHLRVAAALINSRRGTSRS